MMIDIWFFFVFMSVCGLAGAAICAAVLSYMEDRRKKKDVRKTTLPFARR